MKPKILLLAASALVLSAASAVAQVSVFTITDLLTSDSYTDSNTAQTFSGTGFVGLYSSAATSSDQFAHLFGIEQSNYSRTAMQVDVSSLIGKTILSATLSYDLLNGEAFSQTVTATSYTSTGALGYFWTPPSNNGQVSFTSVGRSSNSADVTSLLSAAIGASQNWFGLQLQGSSSYQWTYTSDNSGPFDADSANVRLTVRYANADPAPGAVPEPSTYGLFGAVALLSLTAWKRSRRVANAV